MTRNTSHSLSARDERPWWEPPQDEAPAILPLSAVLASTPVIAIMVAGGRVYSNGVEFQVELRARRRGLSDGEWDQVREAFFGRPGTPYGRDGDLALSLCVAVDDGPEINAVGPLRALDEPELGAAGFSAAFTRPGGSGNPAAMTASPGLWLWRLPAGRQLTLSVKWPAMEVPETCVLFDVSGAAALQGQSRLIWN
jgi:hypothetical protein